VTQVADVTRMPATAGQSSLAALVRLEDPSFYGDPGPVYRRLRDERPVFLYEPLNLLVVSRYSDIRSVAARPREFSSSKGLLLSEFRYTKDAGRNVLEDFLDPAGRFLEHADPPEHRTLRNLLEPWFRPRAVQARRAAIDRLCAQLLDDIGDGEPVDFVTAVAARLPMLVIADILGIVDVEFDQVLMWSDALESLSANLQSEASIHAAAEVFETLQEYLRRAFRDSGRLGTDNLIGSFLRQTVDEQPVTEAMALVYISALLASNDTSRSLLAGLIVALAEHPDAWDLLRTNPGLIPATVEEGLRWVTPARGFGRTATVDCDIDGQPVDLGQHVYLLFESGNRDPRAFPHPDHFDIARIDPLLHLSFGTGPHICQAAHLVRIEAAALLAAVISRYRTIRLVDEPRPVEGILRNGWESVKVKFYRRKQGDDK
jgi:cytochrome P450